jgi:hypothetical protein
LWDFEGCILCDGGVQNSQHFDWDSWGLRDIAFINNFKKTKMITMVSWHFRNHLFLASRFTKP